MEEEFYDFLGKLILALLETDHLFTYNYLVTELHISRTVLSNLKRGKDMRLHYYLCLISYVTEFIRLTICIAVLLKIVKKVLVDHMDLMVGVVPHNNKKDAAPEAWFALVKWE